MQFETLLSGGILTIPIDEQIVFDQLDQQDDAIWSLLLATGYLKIQKIETRTDSEGMEIDWYTLKLTNLEVKIMFANMVRGWFKGGRYFGEFITAMFRGNEMDMNQYMNQVMLNVFSYFDAGKESGASKPEKFYHGLVLGLLVDQAANYELKSKRESGFGRYDVMLIPRKITDPAVILEFKVMNTETGEHALKDTTASALKQIKEKKYETELLNQEIPAENILKYGFAFRGKECLIMRG